MNVAVLSIGDELLGGRIVDTNAAYLSAEVTALGGVTLVRMTVGDDRGDIFEAMRQLAGVADVVLVTGGLGPTPDDLTRFAAADLVDGGELLDDETAMAGVHAWCKRAGVPASEARLMVGKRPPSSSFLSNDCGTAPGIQVVSGGANMFMLPGPPLEMQSMWRRHARPLLEQMVEPRHAPIEVIAAGLTEVQAADMLGDLLDRDRRPRLGIRVGRGVVRVSVEDPIGDLGSDTMKGCAAEVRDRLSPWSLGVGVASLSEAVGEALRRRGWMLATAESCTGGGIGAAVTSQPGSSNWYSGGWVTYTNEMKCRQLGVPSELLCETGPGAVSAEVVVAMAQGACEQSGADIAIAVSGIAGPAGGTEAKPVGTVWIGLVIGDEAEARCIRAPGGRPQIRQTTVDSALQWVRWRCAGINETLPWEVNA